ncbi:hypothetical protein DRO58_04550 [Candidatus Bathyarchaeota archaeon]|nr:MAG: hypothetical protein DRO58_04550 [Candidatus Bathyarchaeota archaeon]
MYVVCRASRSNVALSLNKPPTLTIEALLKILPTPPYLCELPKRKRLYVSLSLNIYIVLEVIK